MTFDLAPRAQIDLELIGDHIAKDDAAAAIRLVDAFKRRWAALGRHPYSGRPRADLLPDLRQTVVGSYISYYRATSTGVEILRVMDTRRNISAGDLDD